MTSVKKILFPLFSLFLIYRSIELLTHLLSTVPESYNTYETILLSILLNAFITGVYAFPGFTYKTSLLLPENYYKIEHPTSISTLYKNLGIRHFKALLLVFFWGRNKNRKKYFDGTKKGLENLIYQSKQSEFGHLSAFISLLLVSLIVVIKGYLFLSILTMLINVIGNLYPVILQRHHRYRIMRITEQTPIDHYI